MCELVASLLSLTFYFVLLTSVPININVTTCRETSTRVRYAGKYMFTSVSASYAFGVDKKMLLCVVLVR